jgi:hypothetical protein
MPGARANPRSVIVPGDEAIYADFERRIGRSERQVADPTPWIYVGSGAPAPDFQNGFFNVGPPRVLLRYRFLRPYDPDAVQDAVQIQGSIGGGGDGLEIFTLLFPEYKPNGEDVWTTYTLDYDIHLTCTDDDANLVIISVIGATGKVYLGFV